MSQTPATLFMIWRPWLGPLQLALATKLAAEGARIHLYVTRKPEQATLQRMAPAGVFERIVPFQIIYDVACAPLDPSHDMQAQDMQAKARQTEAWLGRPLGHLFVGDRHLGRGFALGGPMFPTSQQSRASYEQALAGMCAQIDFWRQELETHRPDVVLENDPVLDLVAQRMEVPIRSVAISRHANWHYWGYDGMWRTPQLEAAYRALTDTDIAPQQVEQNSHTVNYWKTAMDSARLAWFVRRAGRQVATALWHRLKRLPVGPTYDSRSTIAYLWRRRRQSRLMTGPRCVRLSELDGKRFVYFPLATEPEMTLQGISPEYFFQLESIAAIARDLPADVLLVVKEHHPACGARADIFFEQLWAFKNLRILDMREPGLEVIRKAAVTITIAGSSGFEAAAMGKPVIQFGRNNIFGFLPHVRTVTDIAHLREALDEALDGRLAGSGAARDGARFLAAIERISFDMGKFDIYNGAPRVNEASVAAALEKLQASLVPGPQTGALRS